jgi:hypothetical protein
MVQAFTLVSAAALCVTFVLMVIGLNSPSDADQGSADAAKLLMVALEKYRGAKGAYPLLVDKPVTSLKSTLVDGGFLKEIPPAVAPMRYVSPDGKIYGILSQRNGKPCLIEVGARNTGWWGLTAANLCSYD